MTLDPAAIVSVPAPGRECGTCTMCCRVYDIPALDKPAGKWCQHCTPGRGCNAYDTRPQQCRSFYCFWMLTDFLGPEWRPDRAKFVITIDTVSKFMLVQVDPSQPTAWKREPYHSQFRKWAAVNIQLGRQVIIFVNRAATVVLPDKDVPLGAFAPDDRVVISSRMLLGGGTEYIAEKRKVQPGN